MIRKDHISTAEHDMIIKSRKFIEKIEMAYSDTDSLHYEVTMTEAGKAYTFDEVVSELVFSLHMDRSNFSVLAKNGPDFDKRRMDLFKSEANDNIVTECIYVNPKCYSIKIVKRSAGGVAPVATTAAATDDDRLIYKKAMKSCPRSLVDMHFDHDYYKKVVIEELMHNTTSVESLHIKFNKILGRMVTTSLRRRPITTVDTKRFI